MDTNFLRLSMICLILIHSLRAMKKAQRFRGKYSPGDIFKFLVFLRILRPDSKRATFQLKNGFYEMCTDFTLPDIYRSLDHFANFEVELQRHLNERVKETIGRDLSYAFYDVTNYFFEIDFPNGEEDLRKRGVSKEHLTSPITAMGLFIDSKGLPISMSIFPGNTSESLTLQPTMNDVKESYGLGRLVVVADKGVNSSKNIDMIVESGDGFVFSQVLKGKKGKREEKLNKAACSVKNNAYSIKKGVDEYTKESIIDKKTGEVLENTKKRRSVDLEKAEIDAIFDRYFCIITSELDYDERKMRQVYSGLWRIEQSFTVMKSDLYARPVFVSTNEHIRAHFLICFVALLIIRIIQYHMREKALSAERIARALGAATCQVLKGGIVHLDDVGGAIAFQKIRDKKGILVDTLAYSDEDEIALDYELIQDTYGTDCYNIYLRQEVFNKFLKNITL